MRHGCVHVSYYACNNIRDVEGRQQVNVLNRELKSSPISAFLGNSRATKSLLDSKFSKSQTDQSAALAA